MSGNAKFLVDRVTYIYTDIQTDRQTPLTNYILLLLCPLNSVVVDIAGDIVVVVGVVDNAVADGLLLLLLPLYDLHVAYTGVVVVVVVEQMICAVSGVVDAVYTNAVLVAVLAAVAVERVPDFFLEQKHTK